MPSNKLLRHNVRRLHQLRELGWTYPQLCREFGVTSTQVGRILSGEQWQDVWLEFRDPEKYEAWKRNQQERGVGLAELPPDFDTDALTKELLEIQNKRLVEKP
jgi:hypothetical protein